MPLTESMPPAAPEAMLRLFLPDWHVFDTVLRSPLPFVLWLVGDQPLLYHWLDEAVDRDAQGVALHCIDRPAEVRSAMDAATLWPLSWSLRPVAHSGAVDPEVEPLVCLPGMAPPAPTPHDGWTLLDYWFALRRQWFDRVQAQSPEHGRRLSIGRYCSIHPSAELVPPYWIEDNVQIGPGAVVGPYVSVGRGSVIEGDASVENAFIAPFTLLARHTEVKDAILDGGRLLHLRHRVEVSGLDAVVAAPLRRPEGRPGLWERAAAGGLYAALSAVRWRGRGHGPHLDTYDGLSLRSDRGSSLTARRPWLKEVVWGNMRLFGVLPRSAEQLASIDEQWRALIQQAPSGVLSYADLHGVHDADEEMEAVHAAFQAAAPSEALQTLCREKIKDALRRKFRRR